MPAEERYAEPLNYTPGELVRSIDEPIRVGTMLWVFTDPHRGHEFAYNRWYERDHYYGGCMIGPNTVAGGRFVATRAHKDARLPAQIDMPFDRLDGSYAVLYYLLDGHHDDWLAWSTPQVHALYAADRGFAPRTHYNTGVYRLDWRSYRDPDPIPLELALDHRYAGMVAVFLAAEDHQTMDDWFAGYLGDWLTGSPVSTVATFTNVPLTPDKPDFVPVDEEVAKQRLQIYFVETDPLECWDRFETLVAAINDGGAARVTIAAPFVTTVIGTDKYVDQIW